MSYRIMMILSQGRKREKLAIINRNIKSAKSDAAENGHTYGIDCLNLDDTVHEVDNDSVHKEDNAYGHNSILILAQSRIG